MIIGMGTVQSTGPDSHGNEPPDVPVTGALPASLTSFVGRARELDELRSLFRQGKRLVTLVGVGGIGKTRLALELGFSAKDLGWANVYLVDLILTSPRPRPPDQLIWEPLAAERLELVVPPDHPLAARKRIRLPEVAQEPFVALSGVSEFREISDRLCHEAGFSPTVAFEADDVATVRALVGAGLGVAILPALHRPSASDAPATLAIAGQDATRPVGLAWMPGRQLPALADVFRTWLITTAPSWDW
jgi:LysR substrate binding domain-containing protein